MRFLIVDDHPLTCQGLAALLIATHPETSAVSAHTAVQAQIELKTLPLFDWVFLDINLPDDPHHHLFSDLCRTTWISRTILISAEPQNLLIQKALAAGARGFIPKTAHPELVLSGFAHILTGEIYVPPYLAHHLLNPLASEATQRGLSPRLLQVQNQMLQGASNKVIARNLNLSVYTVQEYVSSVLSFHEVANRLDLVLKINANQ
jgi:two-component system nitrate/nitrite response regulator NarL